MFSIYLGIYQTSLQAVVQIVQQQLSTNRTWENLVVVQSTRLGSHLVSSITGICNGSEGMDLPAKAEASRQREPPFSMSFM